MLFDTSVRRELARSFGATLVVILTIVLTMFLIRVVRQAALGVVAPQDVVLLLGYVALGQLPTILALSLFVAVVLCLGRMYRDEEMVIWFSSGVGITRFVRPVLATAWPVLLVVGLLLLFVWPWGNRSSAEMRDRYAQRSDLARGAPGVFQSSSDGRRVFFVERESADGINARNVFILTRQDNSEAVTSARSGRLEVDGDRRVLVLERGQRNDIELVGGASSGEKSQSRFESYRLTVDERATREMTNPPAKVLETLDLIRQPSARNQGELAWRFGLFLAAGNLLLLGIGLSAVNPRRASNWNLLFALLTFVVYFNLINLTQAWVAGGRLGLGAALMGLHGGAFVLALALLWWRDRATVLRWWPARQRRAAR